MKIIYMNKNLACYWGWPSLVMFKISKDWYEFYDGNDYLLLTSLFPEEKEWIDKYMFLHEGEGIGDHAYFSVLGNKDKLLTSRDRLTYIEISHSKGVIKSFLTYMGSKNLLCFNLSEDEDVYIDFSEDMNILRQNILSETGIDFKELEVNTK